MPDLSTEQFQAIVVASADFSDAGERYVAARDSLAGVLYDTVVANRTGLGTLSAITGMHHNTVAALVRRAAGGDGKLPDGWEQYELPLDDNAQRAAAIATQQQTTTTPGGLFDPSFVLPVAITQAPYHATTQVAGLGL